ncbi:MAG: MerR family transcriptional regulator, partial [Gammaproteobacteria bacterium]|nr:MerR family transcriptional regulator [Gammaproteobacteria bacterium]
MTVPASGTVGDLFKIGVVASRTGISVERLRAWERRYGLAPAHRDGQTRFYSEAQVERLLAIK